jgi:phenylalanyl-tRNA synthetase beta chain
MRLLAAGMRPVSNVVDVSNYVMLELGKPIHTFDAQSVARGNDGKATLIVRRARGGERLETLDHVDRSLDPETLLIADPNGPLGIAGVMGGANSEIGPETTDVLVESAIFDPVSIRRTGQRYGLRSEASLRFEKGQEFRLARIGADRTARLIGEWAGGTIARGRVDTSPEEPDRIRVVFRPARVNRLLGTDIEPDEQQGLLERVGVETEAAHPAELVTVALKPDLVAVEPVPGEAVAALVPTWRRDIVIEADVAEEIARVHGYEQVPSITPHTPMPDYRPSPLEVRDQVREILVGAGLTETATFALVSPAHIEQTRLRAPVPSIADDPEPGGSPVIVTNPLSRDHSILRQGLIGSLLDVVSTNVRHGRPDVAIFEVGKGYAKDADRPKEWWRLGFALTGAADPPAWNQAARSYDLDDAKGVVELLCRELGFDAPTYVAEPDEPIFHPGRTARVTARRGGAETLTGIVGELHPALLERLELRAGRVIAAELAIEGLSGGLRLVVRSTPPSRHPTVERDLAIIVDERRPAAEVSAAIRRHGGPLLRNVALFDIYRGAPLAAGEKSLAERLTFADPERTLTEGEVDKAIAAITAGLRDDLGAKLRT